MRCSMGLLLVLTLSLFGQTMPANPSAPRPSPAASTARGNVPAAFVVSEVDASQYKVEGNVSYGPHAANVADILYPAGMVKNDPSGRKRPGVIMFHGGGWIRTSKSTMPTFYNRFLARGFVVCNVEYRLGDRTGQFSPEFAPAPAAVEDALRAAKWFYDHAVEYNVDREKMVVTGASAGGHLALMVGMASPEAKLGPTHPADYKIAAIVNGYGPTDVNDLITRGTSWARQWVPEDAPEREALARRVSPVTYARKEIPPLITVHGSEDRTVPVPQAELLDRLLREKGADVTLHMVQGAGHGYQSPPTAWPDAEKAIFGFLAKKGIISEAP